MTRSGFIHIHRVKDENESRHHGKSPSSDEEKKMSEEECTHLGHSLLSEIRNFITTICGQRCAPLTESDCSYAAANAKFKSTLRLKVL